MTAIKSRKGKFSRKAAARAAGATAVALLVTATPPATASVPSSPTGAWTLPFGGAFASNSTGATPGMLVVGDSLVQFGGAQAHADTMRWITGKSTVAAAAGGASYSHWIRDNLMQGTGLSTLQGYVNFFKPRMTVIALGTNDARILNEDPNYTATDVENSIVMAVAAARTQSKCVMLINVHTQANFAGKVPTVNAKLSQVAARYTDNSVRVANWNGTINGQAWYDNDNVHHNTTGQEQYRSFIANSANGALGTVPCK